ncbi:hypothetical protein EVAR_87543_1 [Eumeta japonica]|uniref:Uncharacterized protein n=1 Tax=Eumeta variegata TaxID=151549 RepID=A0A4C1XTQ2_EUMVA|nr:hypothetical protein EVAR_87543_1 [Eumeta japonica]
MKKYLKNTKEEDVSGASGQISQQKSRTRCEEKEKLLRVLSVPKEERISGKGRNALKAALESGLEITKEQALDILGKLIKDLRGFADPKVNVHKPIKNQMASIEGVFEELEKLEIQEQNKHQGTLDTQRGALRIQKKLKDLGLSHSNKKQEVVNEPPQNSVQPNKKPGWEKVQSRRDKRKERKKQPPEKPPVLQPKPN